MQLNPSSKLPGILSFQSFPQLPPVSTSPGLTASRRIEVSFTKRGPLTAYIRIRIPWGLLMCWVFHTQPWSRIRVPGDKESACIQASQEICRPLRLENHLPRLSSQLPLPEQYTNSCIIVESTFISFSLHIPRSFLRCHLCWWTYQRKRSKRQGHGNSV